MIEMILEAIAGSVAGFGSKKGWTANKISIIVAAIFFFGMMTHELATSHELIFNDTVFVAIVSFAIYAAIFSFIKIAMFIESRKF